jgi:predicted metalloprotease with PDZ domain
MMSSPPEGSLFWFTEGFTEYYVVKLNYRSQLISLDNYVEHYVRLLCIFCASGTK